MFDDPVKSFLLAGGPYCELELCITDSQKVLYQQRGQLWEAFLKYSQRTGRPLIILIGGCSNVGKSSWALEIAHRFGIRNIVHTDTVRNVLRNLPAKDKYPAVHYSSYQCWKACAKTYSPQALIEGFQEQSRAILPYVNSLIAEAFDSGKFTIIEGMHLIPSLMNLEHLQQLNSLMFFLTVNLPSLQRERLIDRCESTYLGRHNKKYEPHIDAFRTLRNFLVSEAQKLSIVVMNNENASKTLDHVIDLIYSHISGIMESTFQAPA